MKRFWLPFSVLLLCLLAACGGKKSEDPGPVTYTEGLDTIPALEQVMNKKTGGTLTAVLKSPQEGEDGEKPAPDPDALPYTAYDYQQFTMDKTGGVVKDYIALLTNEFNGLTCKNGLTDDIYKEAAGSITLTRHAAAESMAPPAEEKDKKEKKKKKDKDKDKEESEPQPSKPVPYSSIKQDPIKLLRVRIDWTPTSCLVTLDHPDQQDFAQSLLGAGTLLTFSSAKDLMYSVTPDEIGLPGTSMEEYIMKPGPGFVRVDDTACLSIDVYEKNDTGTNSLVGQYFISTDGASLYRKVGDSLREVEKIELESGYTPPSEEEVENADEGGKSDDKKDK